MTLSVPSGGTLTRFPRNKHPSCTESSLQYLWKGGTLAVLHGDFLGVVDSSLST